MRGDVRHKHNLLLQEILAWSFRNIHLMDVMDGNKTPMILHLKLYVVCTVSVNK